MIVITSKPVGLSPEEIQFFHREGYLIVPDVLDPEDLEPMRQELHRRIRDKARELQASGRLGEPHEGLGVDRQLAAIYQDSYELGELILKDLDGAGWAGSHAREMFDLITHPSLLRVLAQLLDSGEIIASSAYRLRPKLPKLGRGVIPWHQDSGYFTPLCDDHLIVTCWVPLVDATVANGCMRILPRSHQGPVARHRVGVDAVWLVIEDEDLPNDPSTAITAPCPRGGAVFMTNRTPHSSTPNDSDHIRWSIDLRYQASSVPTNVDLAPASDDPKSGANVHFFERSRHACYPPEADFLVSSQGDPRRVSTYEEYVRRRKRHEQMGIRFSSNDRWSDGAQTAS